MSFKALQFVIANCRVGGFAQGVLLYLANCHNEQSGQCNPSREHMREFFSSPDSPCTLKRIDRALAELRTAGVVESRKVRVSKGVLNFYSFPGLDSFEVAPKMNLTPKTEANPQYGVDPKTGANPQNVQGVDPKMGATGNPQNGGCNHKKETEVETESISRQEEQAVVNEFHARCKALPHVRDLTDRRRTLIRARLKDSGKDEILEVFDKAGKSDFLCGRKTKWKANFDWLLNKTNFTKVIEGNYDEVHTAPTVNGFVELTQEQRHEIGYGYDF